MKVNYNENIIEINANNYPLDDVVMRFAKLSGKQIGNFLENRKIKIPRSFRMQAIRTVLNQKIIVAKQLNLTDEQKYRLLWYPEFCEFQLETFFQLMCDEEMFELYKKNLWTILLTSYKQLKISEEDVLILLTVEPEEEKETMQEFQKNFFDVTYDVSTKFDGLDLPTFRRVLKKSSTLVELRELGAKYSLPIPRRLKKDELQQIIVEELQARGEYDDAVAAKLEKMPVLALQRFAINNGIKASIELKKEELVEYILKQVAKSKNVKFQDKEPTMVYIPSIMDFEFTRDYIRDVELAQEKIDNEQYLAEQLRLAQEALAAQEKAALEAQQALAEKELSEHELELERERLYLLRKASGLENDESFEEFIDDMDEEVVDNPVIEEENEILIEDEVEEETPTKDVIVSEEVLKNNLEENIQEEMIESQEVVEETPEVTEEESTEVTEEESTEVTEEEISETVDDDAVIIIEEEAEETERPIENAMYSEKIAKLLNQPLMDEETEEVTDEPTPEVEFSEITEMPVEEVKDEKILLYQTPFLRDASVDEAKSANFRTFDEYLKANKAEKEQIMFLRAEEERAKAYEYFKRENEMKKLDLDIREMNYRNKQRKRRKVFRVIKWIIVILIILVLLVTGVLMIDVLNETTTNSFIQSIKDLVANMKKGMPFLENYAKVISDIINKIKNLGK